MSMYRYICMHIYEYMCRYISICIYMNIQKYPYKIYIYITLHSLYTKFNIIELY